jgi:hypothetical protein
MSFPISVIITNNRKSAIYSKNQVTNIDFRALQEKIKIATKSRQIILTTTLKYFIQLT